MADQSHKWLVTGAGGFIGSHLSKRLLDEGRQVVLIDDLSRGSIQNLLDLGVRDKCYKADLRESGQWQNLLAGVSTVFHMAARVGSVEYLHGSNMAELLTLQTNLVIDANVFQACLRNGVERIIYASSISVYPVQTQTRPNAVFAEDDIEPFSPEGGYGWAKLVGEIGLRWMKDIAVGIARIFNVYGENAALGETSQVIPSLITKSLRYPKEKFIVWGNGEQTRDFLYVADCVEALLRLEKRVSTPPVVLNVGSGEPVAIKTIAEKIARLSGENPEVIYDVTRSVGPLSRTADISRAKRLLGWQPVTTLDEGLQRTYSWVKRRLAWSEASKERSDKEVKS